MACMDFVPANTSDGGLFSWPVFAQFCTCVESANNWLVQNPNTRIISCETLTMKGMYGSRYEFSSELSTTTDHYTRQNGKSSQTYGACSLKGLRIWYLPQNTGPPQRLSYTTLVPTCLDSSGKPTFEDFDATIAKYNHQVGYTQPTGFVLNIEVVKQPCGTSGKMEPERTCYQHKDYALNLIRIWFIEGGVSMPEEIGCADFVPQAIHVDGQKSLERLQTVMQRAQSWLQQQYGGVRFTNVQSVHLKAKSESLDSKRALNHFWIPTEMVQFVRVWYVKPLIDMPIPAPPAMLSYFTIEPAKARTGGEKERKYETIHQMARRHHRWLMQCGARILGIQTVPVPCKYGSEVYPPDGARHVLKKNSRFHLRVYFDGVIRTPWEGVVDAAPPVEDVSCCTVI